MFQIPPRNVQSLSIPHWDEIPELSGSSPKVVFLGDSVLDNFIWLREPHRDLAYELQNILRSSESFSEYICINLAMDETSTYDLLARTKSYHPWDTYASARRQVFTGDPLKSRYLEFSDGNYYPIEILRRLRNVRYVVLSVGGNDVMLNAENQQRLAQSVVLRSKSEEVAAELLQRLLVCVHEIYSAAPEAWLVPVLVYHPHNAFSISGLGIGGGFLGSIARFAQRQCLSSLVTPLARTVLNLCLSGGMPLLDLSHTLDPNNATHYGTSDVQGVNALGVSWSGAEPSNEATVLMARMISSIMLDAVSAVQPRREVLLGLIEDIASAGNEGHGGAEWLTTAQLPASPVRPFSSAMMRAHEAARGRLACSAPPPREKTSAQTAAVASSSDLSKKRKSSVPDAPPPVGMPFVYAASSRRLITPALIGSFFFGA